MANSNASLFQNWQRTPTPISMPGYTTLKNTAAISASNKALGGAGVKYQPSGGGTAATTTSNNAALSAALASQNQASTPASGIGYTYTPTSTPVSAYTPQAYQVNLPSIDWSFNPSSDQRSAWNTQATATAAQEIDPQLLAIKAALDAYMVQGQNQRNELNPRYTNQSLAIANIIQNSVKQGAVDSAIRRGAENSGWLPSALMQAGQLETQQRGDVETQRNSDLSQLAALEAAQSQAAGEQNTMLEGLRGKRITSALADLENAAWQRDLQTKESQWNSALGGEQIRASAYGSNAQNELAGYQTQASVAQAEQDRALQAALAEQEQANTEWNQNYTTSQDNYQRALQAAQLAQKGVTSDPYANLVPVTINGKTVYVSASLANEMNQQNRPATETAAEKLQRIAAEDALAQYLRDKAKAQGNSGYGSSASDFQLQ